MPLRNPSEFAKSLSAWAALMASMMVSGAVFGTLAVAATEPSSFDLREWRSTVAMAPFIAILVGAVTAVLGPFFLIFLPSVLQPSFPFFRRGFWVFAVGPNVPFFAIYLLERVIGMDSGAYDPGNLGIHTVIVIPGALIFIAVGRPLGLFDKWRHQAARSNQPMPSL